MPEKHLKILWVYVVDLISHSICLTCAQRVKVGVSLSGGATVKKEEDDAAVKKEAEGDADVKKEATASEVKSDPSPPLSPKAASAEVKSEPTQPQPKREKKSDDDEDL